MHFGVFFLLLYTVVFSLVFFGASLVPEPTFCSDSGMTVGKKSLDIDEIGNI